MNNHKFYEEIAPMLVKLGYCKYDGPIWQETGSWMNKGNCHCKKIGKRGHWMDIVLYHMGFCVTLETGDTEEQIKRLRKLKIGV